MNFGPAGHKPIIAFFFKAALVLRLSLIHIFPFFDALRDKPTSGVTAEREKVKKKQAGKEREKKNEGPNFSGLAC